MTSWTLDGYVVVFGVSPIAVGGWMPSRSFRCLVIDSYLVSLQDGRIQVCHRVIQEEAIGRVAIPPPRSVRTTFLDRLFFLISS